MKGFIFVVILGLILLACSGNKGLVKVTPLDEDELVADSLEYELITFDNRFEVWYDINNRESLYRSQGFYESWNKQYVSAWNIKTSQDPFFEPIVGYEYSVDYGFELNHRLFYYFQYVENVLKKSILSRSGPHVMLMN